MKHAIIVNEVVYINRESICSKFGLKMSELKIAIGNAAKQNGKYYYKKYDMRIELLPISYCEEAINTYRKALNPQLNPPQTVKKLEEKPGLRELLARSK